ncbi:hypothetical protein B0H34DRAFT_801815 [Crassisporium funariophilum]|nr:hypothetical protein B0H34DRAFT_801815 [Crassisporium funariophilum]
MSLVQAAFPLPLPHQQDSSARKRTSSFSYPTSAPTPFCPNPRPAKAPRISQMGTLRRTESMLVLPEMHATAATNSVKEPTNTVPYYRTLQYYKDQRLRRKGVVNRSIAEPITIRTRLEVTSTQPARQVPQQQPQSQPPLPAARSPATPKPRKSTLTVAKRATPTPQAPSQVILPSVSSPITIVRTHRTSSPLSPERTVLPGRPVFPRSKPEPDLYRTAIKSHMRSSPEGQKILHMGPRLALSITTATKELERIVADQQERDRDMDVVMTDSTTTPMYGSGLAMPVLTTSWVVVRGEDWEMVDCSA